jgi:hypothetical protein
MFIRAFGLAILPVLLVSCASIWNLGNRSSLEADVLEVLRPASKDGLSLECRMIGTTRSAYCLGEISDDEAAAWAQALALESFRINLEDAASTPPLGAEGPVGCLSAEVFPGVDGLPAFWIGGRPLQLALGSGGQFEYLLLIVNAATGQGCVQVSYAYG